MLSASGALSLLGWPGDTLIAARFLHLWRSGCAFTPSVQSQVLQRAQRHICLLPWSSHNWAVEPCSYTSSPTSSLPVRGLGHVFLHKGALTSSILERGPSASLHDHTRWSSPLGNLEQSMGGFGRRGMKPWIWHIIKWVVTKESRALGLCPDSMFGWEDGLPHSEK